MNYFKSSNAIMLGLIFAIGFSACKKMKDPERCATHDMASAIAPDETIDAQIENLGNFMEEPIISEATETEDVFIQSLPDIIALDYFNTEASGDAGTPGGDRMGSDKKRDSSLHACKAALRLAVENKEALKRAHAAKMECMKANHQVLRESDSAVRKWAINHRRELLQKHENTLKEIQAAFSAGKITERERAAKIAAARESLQQALSKIRMTVKEKLQNNRERAAAAGLIKNCERIYLNRVMEILGKDNYAIWIRCHKMHYRQNKMVRWCPTVM